MKDSTNEIDKIIRDKVSNYEEIGSSTLWSRLNSRLSSSRNLNIGIILSAIITGLFLWFMVPKAENTDFDNTQKHKIITHNNEAIFSELSSDEESTKSKTDGPQSLNETIPAAITTFKHTTEKMQSSPFQEQLHTENPSNDLTLNSISNSVEKNINGHANTIKPIEYIRSAKLANTDLDHSTFIINKNEPFQAIGIEKTIPRFSISMEVGIDKLYRKLSFSDELRDFAKNREENESYSSTISYGLLLNYHHSNFTISSGLRFSSIVESLNYKKNKIVTDPDGGYFEIDTVSITIYDENNSPASLIIGYNSAWIDEYHEVQYNVSSKNEYSYIDIPIKLSYNINYGSIKLSPSLGGSIGFLYKAKGLLPIIDSMEFVDINRNSEYLNKFIPSLEFGIMLEYRISPNYRIYMEPNIKYRLKSIYSNKYPVGASYTNVGLRFGIMINL